MNYRIDINNITKIFFKNSRQTSSENNELHEGDKKALDNITLTIQAGERLGIIGPNGAGKSTLLSIIAGITRQTSGTVDINGKVTAVLTLGTGLREDLTGRENIYINGELQGKTREEINKDIEQIIEFADIGEFIDYPLRTYSTGMKSRLGFAMITNLEPEILILDEALSAGDIFFSSKATAKMQELCNKGSIVILVSHGDQAVETMCNRAIWMDNGCVIMEGKPRDVCSAYRESVRQRNESLLNEKYKHLAGGNTDRDSCSIHELDFFGIDSGGNNCNLLTGSTAQCTIKLSYQKLKKPDLLLKLQRLDGVDVFSSKLSASEMHLPINNAVDLAIKCNLNPLYIAYGLYRLTATLIDNNKNIATFTKIIEIETQNPPRGGRPLMIYPSRFDAVLIEKTKENVNLHVEEAIN